MVSESQQQDATRVARRTTMDPAVMAAVGSVLLSWMFFFVRGDREMGIFVGLWPPTILAFASYFEQTRMGDMVHRAFDTGAMLSPARQEGIVEQIRQRV